MSNKKIYKNRLSLPIFDNKGIGNGNGIAYIPNVIRGGSAIPIGNNMFLMRGRSHAQGGIDIGKDLEVEGNEVVQNGKFGTKVFSSVPFLRGVSPAERVLRGENPDTVFAAQETWKRVNKVADDGSKRAALGLSLFRPNSFKVRRVPINDFITPTLGEVEESETPSYVLKDDEKPVGKKVNPSIIGGGRLYNGYAVDNHEGENVNGIGGGRVYTARPIDEFATDSVSFGDVKSPRGFKEQDADYIYDYLSKHSDLTDTAKAAILATAAFESGMNPRAKNKYSTAKGYFQWLDDRYIPTPGLNDEQERIAQLNKIIDDMTPVKGKAKGWTQTKTRNIFDLANEFRTTDDIDRAVEIITRHHIRPSLGEEPRKNKQGVEVDKGYKWEIAERRKVAKQFYNRMFNRKNKKEFGGMKLNIFKLGGLSRSKDYGSKDKPYPSVNKNDFAGGGRSYPIPTRADAVDALRLAGLHHRSDVRAKVYAKYPDLRKKAKLGKYSKITGSPTNEKVVEPIKTNYVEKNNSSDNLEVGIGTILGGGATLSGLGYAGNKLYDKVLEYNSPTAKKAREYSKFLEKRAADKRAVAKAIADRQKTLNTTYGDKISKELNKSIKKGFAVSPNQPSFNEKRITEFPNSKSTRFEYYDERANAALQNRKTAAFNSIKRVRFLNPLYRIAPVTAAIDFVKNLFPSKQQEQEEDKAWRRYKSPTGRIPEDYQMKFGGRKKAPYGDYVTRRDDSENIIDYIRKRRWRLPFEEDEQTAINRAWSKALQYIDENPNPGDLAINQYEEHPLFRGFYHRENRPIFSTNPMVARWYNYGWSHNAGAEVPNYADILANSNTPKPVVDNTSRRVVTNTSRGRNTNSGVSPAAQRILDNAEIAPYQTFRTPSLTEVTSRYPISERINVGTGTAPISSSTGVQLNPTDVEAVRNGNFKAIDNDRYLPIRTTTEDWIGLGANLLGSIGSYLGTRAMLNRYPMPNKPVPAIAQKLKTRININPQLDTIREQVGRLNTSIDNNTSSSRVAQARKQGVSNNAVASRNQLYGQKENAETQLINQDIMNRQRIGLYNNQIYNDYLNRLGSTRQYLANARISNFNNVLSGANQSIQDLLGRIEDRDAERRNFIFMQAAYPNVNWRNIFQGNPELARSLGFRFVN